MARALSRRSLLAAVAGSLPSAAAQSTSKELRVGVLGTGSRGVGMMRISLGLPGVRITAVCDIDEGRATKAQQIVETATGRRPTPYTRGVDDYKRMLDSPEIDAALVMTPQNQHAAQSIYAMNAGKPVGSETPVAYTIEECWALVEAKRRSARSGSAWRWGRAEAWWSGWCCAGCLCSQRPNGDQCAGCAERIATGEGVSIRDATE